MVLYIHITSKLPLSSSVYNWYQHMMRYFSVSGYFVLRGTKEDTLSVSIKQRAHKLGWSLNSTVQRVCLKIQFHLCSYVTLRCSWIHGIWWEVATTPFLQISIHSYYGHQHLNFSMSLQVIYHATEVPNWIKRPSEKASWGM